MTTSSLLKWATATLTAVTLTLTMTAPVNAAPPADRGPENAKPHGAEATEDTDRNDNTPNNVVDERNDHPSGKDRSVEPGGSGNQGHAAHDPDDDGNGPDRTNGGLDQPGGPGGEDLADQDGNNGCGNDDDFEDDNEGLCLGREGAPGQQMPREAEQDTEATIEEVVQIDDDRQVLASGTVRHVGAGPVTERFAWAEVLGDTTTRTLVAAEVLGVAPIRTLAPTEVLGHTTTRTPVAETAAPGTLPRTGSGSLPVVAVFGAALLVVGAFWIRISRIIRAN